MASTAFPEQCREDLATVRAQVDAGGVCSRLVAKLLNCALTSQCPHRGDCLREVRGLLAELPPET